MTHLVPHQSAPLFSSSMDEDDESGSQTPVLSFYESHIAASITHVYISKPIVEPAAYIPLIQYLNTRTPNDEVHIHFNCPGGRVDTGIQLITATRNCQRIGRINALFTQVQQLWTAVDSFDTPAMQPNPADGEPATLKIYPPLSH